MRKTILCCIAAVFFQIPVIAQNWQLVNPDNLYSYKLGDADIITHVIKVDSVSENANDTILYLNRIVKMYDDLLLRNQPQFLMKRIEIGTNGISFCKDSLDFEIRTQAKLGDTWVFDTTNNITITVTDKSYEQVFEDMDSVKTLTLSNNKTLHLSKNHGILSFPSETQDYYNLVGMQGITNCGERYPMFEDIFNYKVSDVFQMYRYYTAPQEGSELEYSKYYVLSKDSLQDTIAYDLHYLEVVDSWNEESYRDTLLTRKFYRTAYYDALPNQLVYTHGSLNHIRFTSQGKIFKPGFIIEENGDSDTLSWFDLGFSGYMGLIVGYGYEYDYSGSVGIFQNVFTGKITNGDTIGEIYPDSFYHDYYGILSLEESSIKIYPVPANDRLTVEADFLSQDVYITIYDMAGRIVYNQSYTNAQKIITLNIASLRPGMYFIKVHKENNDQIMRKFIKKKM